MRVRIHHLVLVVVLAGCKPETARPVPVEGPASGPTISTGGQEKPAEPEPAAPQAPPDADTEQDAGSMSPEQARETVREKVIEGTGVLKVLGVKSASKETASILSSGEDFNEEEMKALEEALGAVEKKPPPPMKSP